MLGYHKASGLAFVVYKLNKKYSTFEVPKRNGGFRQIDAPSPQLLKLQKSVAKLLSSCRNEIETVSHKKPLSHGFRKKYSIITNAKNHKRRRYVLNIDLQDFSVF